MTTDVQLTDGAVFGEGGFTESVQQAVKEHQYRTSAGIISMWSPYDSQACRDIKSVKFRAFSRAPGSRIPTAVFEVLCANGHVEEWTVNRAGFDKLVGAAKNPPEPGAFDVWAQRAAGFSDADLRHEAAVAKDNMARARQDNAKALALWREQNSLSNAFATVIRDRVADFGEVGDTVSKVATGVLWAVAGLAALYVAKEGSEIYANVRGGRRRRRRR